MGMSPIIFYDLTYKEARLALEGYEKEQEHLYYLNYYATFNAIGIFLGSSKHKKFKPIDPFNSKNEANNESGKKVTQKEKQEILDLFDDYENNK
nr:MAG TPA: hypothetical protein [Caudoviricetes sp.]